jgi:hypothetical protein
LNRSATQSAMQSAMQEEAGGRPREVPDLARHVSLVGVPGTGGDVRETDPWILAGDMPGPLQSYDSQEGRRTVTHFAGEAAPQLPFGQADLIVQIRDARPIRGQTSYGIVDPPIRALRCPCQHVLHEIEKPFRIVDQALEGAPPGRPPQVPEADPEIA